MTIVFVLACQLSSLYKCSAFAIDLTSCQAASVGNKNFKILMVARRTSSGFDMGYELIDHLSLLNWNLEQDCLNTNMYHVW